MKIFCCDQIGKIDRYTIEHEPISAIDLMERAAMGISCQIEENHSRHRRIMVFAGPGDNGGDGLAIARIMATKGYPVEVFLPNAGHSLSASCQINYERLKAMTLVAVRMIGPGEPLPLIKQEDIVIDALFGSGLSRPIEGVYAPIIEHINSSDASVIAVDIPSGLFGEDNSENKGNAIIEADMTFTFQFPKLSFLFPENEKYVGRWKIIDIKLHPDAIRETESPFHLLTRPMIVPLLRSRDKFGHKGNYGHAFLIAGSYGKMGAAVLSSRSCLRSGAGLLTTHIPRAGYEIMQMSVPEAMVSMDISYYYFSIVPPMDRFTAVGIGPGIGTDKASEEAMAALFDQFHRPMVVDADGINLLSGSEKLLNALPSGSILTPHPGEFARLAGKSENSYQMLVKQRQLARKLNQYIILKGAYTSIVFPDGQCFFNTTGNPGMATAGSGDVLTGIILGLLAQGYSSSDASLLGVYLHGLAGDIAVRKNGEESMIAGDLTENIGKAFLALKNRSLINNDYF